MIRAESIFKNFGSQEVLNDISCTFEQGKTNLIIGRSGSGKTVLLKILIGLIPPTSGRVWYDDTDFYSLNKQQT
ncbi:MAG TPA: ATP-binding cassette domain-containing protein, partial [Saprospiraceae bacterium]|nr:ATP-binding cassette domain-containing protein [Saprospiraceae bacterium]